jgi:exoribonuclease-2
MGVWDENEYLDLIRHEVPIDFPEVVLGASDALKLDPLLKDGRRRNLTGIPVFTIDDAFTTDMDDGVSTEFREDGTCRVGVHITDVGALVPVGSELDREAAGRVSSLYFPDRKIPMFPPVVSEVLGSLCPDAPRLALSLFFDLAPDGSAGEAEIVPSVICCREKLTYDRADAILDDPLHPLHASLLTLHRAAEANWIDRLQAGAVALERSELQIRVTPEGEIQVSVRHRNSRSNLLVSELMVMANVAVAEFCRDREIPIVYRTQQAPDLSDLEEAEHEALQRYRILRRMRPAAMSLEAGAHGGLGVALYCQASSPLRRYADLAVQRQLGAFLLGEPLLYDAEGIQQVLFQAEERRREIGRLERRRERYWLFKYLEQSVGQNFEALVLEAWERGFSAEILEYGFRVEVKPSRPVEPGEAVTLRLNRCDPWEDTISFSHLESS